MTNERISVTEQARDSLRDLTRGLGGQYSEVIEYLVSLVCTDGEDEITAGYRLREQYERWLRENDDD